MAIWDFFTKKKLNTLLPNYPLGSQVAIQNGIVTWQGQDAQAFVNDGYVKNDIVYSIVKLITDKAKLAPFHVYKVTDEVSARSKRITQESI
jgi:phage portal protein BeeE